jgi:hypothetical protein
MVEEEKGGENYLLPLKSIPIGGCGQVDVLVLWEPIWL